MLSSERLDSTTHIGEKYRREEGNEGKIKICSWQRKHVLEGMYFLKK